MSEEEYAERRAKRARAVVSYSGTEDFFEDILIASLSAIPRWRYARTLESIGRDQGSARTADSLRALLVSTREIIEGENSLCDHLINECGSQWVLRMCLYSSLMRTALYISEKR